MKPRALPSPARTQFLGPIPKAAALFAQENTAEQQHSHTAKARPTLLWPHHSPLIPAGLDQVPHTAAKHPLPPPAVLAQGLSEGKYRSVFLHLPLMFCSGSRSTRARQMPSACTEGAAEVDDGHYGSKQGKEHGCTKGKRLGCCQQKSREVLGRKRLGCCWGTCRDALEEERLGCSQGRSRDTLRRGKNMDVPGEEG